MSRYNLDSELTDSFLTLWKWRKKKQTIFQFSIKLRNNEIKSIIWIFGFGQFFLSRVRIVVVLFYWSWIQANTMRNTFDGKCDKMWSRQIANIHKIRVSVLWYSRIWHRLHCKQKSLIFFFFAVLIYKMDICSVFKSV